MGFKAAIIILLRSDLLQNSIEFRAAIHFYWVQPCYNSMGYYNSMGFRSAIIPWGSELL